MKLFIISVGAIVFAAALLAMTHFWGLSQPYPTFAHPFLEFARPGLGVRVRNLSEARAVLAKNKASILWLDLAKTQDGYFLVVDLQRKIEMPPELFKENYRGDKTYLYDLKILRLAYDIEPLLEDFLAQFPEQKFILNIRDNAPDVHTSMIQILKKFKAESRVLLQSDAEIVLRAIKDTEPLWLYGTSRSDIMRLLSFDSMWILPATPFAGDVFVSPLKVLKRPAFNDDILSEIRRRKKVVVLGPLLSGAEVATAKTFKPDAYIFDNPAIFIEELDQHPAQ